MGPALRLSLRARTDRHPPFSLGEWPDYPARLDITYPEWLSRGPVPVKWWLPAIRTTSSSASSSAAGTALMTDTYPPFRLDMGGTEPSEPEVLP